MKLVFVTQTLDPGHGALAQTLDLVRALAARTDELAVLTREDLWGGAPVNVTVRTFDAGSKAGRVAAFERALAASLPGADGVLVHMVPTFLTLAAPLAKARRVPLFLWYTHWHASRELRLATLLADVVLSVDLSSFPLRSAKVRGIGHAIDVAEFAGDPPARHEGPLRLLALGRTARWKGLATLIEAFRIAGLGDATLELRGPSLTPDERAHRLELAAAASGDARITLAGSLPRAEVPGLLRAADLVVSPVEPRAGATLDKAVYEAAACSRPVVTTNPTLAPFLAGLPLPLVAPAHDPAALGAVLRHVVEAAPELRAIVGAALRRRVVEHHSLDHWADTVISTVREVRSPRGG
jgi:glycosyltransferase involved in cell wall biosynthesis